MLLPVFAALVAVGCGGDASAESGPVQIGITANRDPTGTWDKIYAECNRKAKGRYVIEPVILPPSVDAQREQVIRRLAGRDESLDLLMLDVMWTGEFAEAKWILDLTERVEPMKGNFVPAAIDTARYADKYWGVPMYVETAMLYYRKDLVKKLPTSWEDMVRIANEVTKQHPDMAGFLWQANQYEGLTVDAMEFILAANGSVLNEDYTEATLDENDGATHAFTFMRKLIEDGTTPRSVTTFQEEESRQAFQQGKGVFLRNWPYVYSLAGQGDSKIKGKYETMPLPPFEGRRAASVLGGRNVAISRYSDGPEEAWDAIMCLSGEESARLRLLNKGDAPALDKLYGDRQLREKTPWLDTMRKSLDNAYNRPNSPYYNDVTIALQRTAHEVVSGKISPEEGVKKADRAIQLAVEGNGEI